MLGWMVRNPYRASILIGFMVAVIFGWVSFPREKTIEKTVTEWLPANIAPLGTVREELAASLASFRAGESDAVTSVSDSEFVGLGLPQTYVDTGGTQGRAEFVIGYAGKDAQGNVYVAERKIPAASSFSPDRWFYKAVDAEVEQFGNVLHLTYERDLSGLAALLLMDVIVGAVYAAIVGMILSVLGMEGLDKNHQPKPLPAPAPMLPINPRNIFRA
jgi:hypothetical protein